MSYRDQQLRYWNAFEAVRAMYKFCDDFTEDRERVTFRFKFPNPVELSDALDTLRALSIPHFYRKAAQLFDPHVDIFIEIDKSRIWLSMFGAYDSRRVRSFSERWT